MIAPLEFVTEPVRVPCLVWAYAIAPQNRKMLSHPARNARTIFDASCREISDLHYSIYPSRLPEHTNLHRRDDEPDRSIPRRPSHPCGPPAVFTFTTRSTPQPSSPLSSLS